MIIPSLHGSLLITDMINNNNNPVSWMVYIVVITFMLIYQSSPRNWDRFHGRSSYRPSVAAPLITVDFPHNQVVYQHGSTEMAGNSMRNCGCGQEARSAWLIRTLPNTWSSGGEFVLGSRRACLLIWTQGTGPAGRRIGRCLRGCGRFAATTKLSETQRRLPLTKATHSLLPNE